MEKRYKVWVEVEEIGSNPETYEKVGEPLYFEVKNEAAAFALQTTLHDIGGTLQGHFKELESPE
jgi:hypothetical protein